MSQAKEAAPQLSAVSSVESPEEDRERMVRVSRGDVRAFQALYERYKRPVMSYVHQLVQNPGVAEEITQEIFLKVYRVRETYRPEAKFSTWLWTIARNAALDHLRKKGESLLDDGTEDGEVSEVAQLESEDAGAEAQLIERADRARLEHCMTELSPLQREALTLRTVSELSYDEIASAMSTSLPSVKSLILRAKGALARCLGKGDACE